MAPSLPQEKTFAELSEVLKVHFEPKPLVIAERFLFHKRSQALGESIANYMAAVSFAMKPSVIASYVA